MSSDNIQSVLHIYGKGLYRPFGEGWEKWHDSVNEWGACPSLPSPWIPSQSVSATALPARSFGFPVYLVGIITVLAVLFVTIFFVSKDPSLIAAVLAPVTGVIGAFTGHAAGHAAARH
jgi:hypothetical protein